MVSGQLTAALDAQGKMMNFGNWLVEKTPTLARPRPESPLPTDVSAYQCDLWANTVVSKGIITNLV